MANPGSHGVSRAVRHKDFYLPGGDTTVMVENHVFRVHSYFFLRESLYFRQKLTVNGDSGSEPERGSDRDTHTVTLEGVTSEDFARFLWVFYNPKYSLYEAPLETWLSILALAEKWSFDNVKELVVRELEKIDIEPVDKIVIYHKNNISRRYLIPSYIAVCKRDKPLTLSEGEDLGMETVLRIADARERIRQQASEHCLRSPTFEDFDDLEVELLVREVFCLRSPPTSPSLATTPNGMTDDLTKLRNPAPSDPPKANGASAPQANGGSVPDTKRTGAEGIPSIGSVLSHMQPVNGHVKTPVTSTSGSSGTNANVTSTTSPFSGGQIKGFQRNGTPGKH